MTKRICVILGDTSLPDPVKHNGKFNSEDIDVIDKLKSALALLNGYEFDYFSEHASLEDRIRKAAEEKSYDYFFNLCDEGFQNLPEMEVHIPMLLELHNLPYTGAAPICLSICYDKHAVKAIAKSAGIPVSEDALISEEDEAKALPFEFPAFVKPNHGDGSFAIDKNSLVHNLEQLKRQIEVIRGRLRNSNAKTDILVEEYLSGEEITAAIIGNKELDIRLLQENFGSETGFSSSDAKWNPNSKEWNLTTSIAPTISDKTKGEIIEYSKYLFQRLECRDYARFDFRMKTRKPYLLEANPNCGWCWDGHLVRAFLLGSCNLGSFSLEGYSSVLEKILTTAEKRFLHNKKDI